eukprot:SAG31_NODE_20152_length_582_cov_0.966874_2_plen_111_part_00
MIDRLVERYHGTQASSKLIRSSAASVRVLMIKNISASGGENVQAISNSEEYALARQSSQQQQLQIQSESLRRWTEVQKKLELHRQTLDFNVLLLPGNASHILFRLCPRRD